MQRSLILHLVGFGLVLPGLAVILAVASLLVGLHQTDGLMRYPQAVRIGEMHLRLDTLVKGYAIQDSAYRSADDLPTVIGWYARYFEVGSDQAGGGLGNCVSLRKSDALLLLRQMIGITLCSQPRGTLIFVNRSLEVRR